MDATLDRLDALIRHHRGLVVAIARGFARRLPPSVSADELEAAGLVGLWQAIERWNPAGGVAFTTYAGQRILGEMEDWLASEGELLNGRTVARRAARGLTTPTIRQFYLVSSGEGRKVIPETDTIPTRDEGHADVDARDMLQRATRGLNRAGRLLATLRWGEGLTLKEAGAAVGLSEAWASLMMTKVMRQLPPALGRASAQAPCPSLPAGSCSRAQSGPLAATRL